PLDPRTEALPVELKEKVQWNRSHEYVTPDKGRLHLHCLQTWLQSMYSPSHYSYGPQADSPSQGIVILPMVDRATSGTNFTLAELGICEPSPHRSGYCSDIGILHQGYSLSTGSDADSDTEGGMSPEHAIRLWGRGIKSRRSSGLSSRENSALTLTDSDNENKSDEENGKLVKYLNDKFKRSSRMVSKLSCLSGSNFDLISKPKGASERMQFGNEGID
ncbi:hypothetical protein KIL84_015741, partial [Mauremys mutica]